MKNEQERRNRPASAPAERGERTGAGRPSNPRREEEEGGTLLCGRNAAREYLASGRDIDKAFVAEGEKEGSILPLIAALRERRVPVVSVPKQKLEMLCGHRNHQGIVLSVSAVSYVELEELLVIAEEKGEPPFLVIADGIEDPHNLGAIIRSAECMGAHGLILPRRRSSGVTAVVAKASAGAIVHLPIARVTNLVATVEELKKRGVWVYGADMNGTPFDSLSYDGAVALVLGSEGEGISRLLREKCDFITSIPMYGQVNSLNVSAAAAILLTEIAGFRHKN